MIDSWSFPATVWLLLAGSAPDAGQEDALRRVLVAACDHGLAAPSIAAARTVASTRGAPGVAVAAGLLAFAGPRTAGRPEPAPRCSTRCAAAPPSGRSRPPRPSASRASGWPREVACPASAIPTTARDPRVPGLLAAAVEDDGYRRLARALEDVLVAEKGPRLHMNADAAVAAVLWTPGCRRARSTS